MSEPEHVMGTSLEEFERCGVHVAVSKPHEPAQISFNARGTMVERSKEGSGVPSRGWVFMIASSSEEAAAELGRMVDERLGLLEQPDH